MDEIVVYTVGFAGSFWLITCGARNILLAISIGISSVLEERRDGREAEQFLMDKRG